MTESNAKTIYVVTGGKHLSCPNPSLVQKGIAKLRKLRNKLPAQPGKVVCGTGRRHREMAYFLYLTPDNFTILAGTADSFQKRKRGALCTFADDKRVPATIVTSTDDIHDAVRFYIRNNLPHNTVVCASKSFLRALQSSLGIQNEILPATVYKIDVDRGGHISIVKL